MKQNILLLSTIYPLPSSDNKGTSVCHYFTKEWVKMGYNVRVVHFQTVYPLPFYWLARLNRKLIVAKTGAVVYTSRDKGANYERDGVLVNRIPLFKFIPHGKFSHKAITNVIQKIERWNESVDFTPDIIIGHFPNPQIEVVNLLKKIYPSAKTCIVMHGDIGLAKKVYGKKLLSLVHNIDVWGFRNPQVQKSFEKYIMHPKHSFMCYSGIPEVFLSITNPHSFEHPIRRFLFVGELIERKYPEKVLDALVLAYPDKDFVLHFVGEGHLSDLLIQKANDSYLQNNVVLKGRIPRNEIIEQYDQADCMIMISRSEAYGLVYLEAMARGCITIASRNEGFDGIIKNGYNGYLCKAGDAVELASIINEIRSLSVSQLKSISNNAIETASKLTDHLAAFQYIEDIKLSV